MKTRFISLLLLLITCFAWAQENDYSTLHIWLGRGYSKSSQVVIVINNQRIGSINRKQLLEYKVYSEGTLNVEVFSGGVARQLLQIDVQPGNNYYLYTYVKVTTYYLKEISKDEAAKYLEDSGYFKKVLEFEEDRSNPLAELPDGWNKGAGQGTGFLLNEEGYILTNHHVIDGADKIMVYGINGEFGVKFDANVIAVDQGNDLALIQVTSSLIEFTAPPYHLQSSSSVKTGQNVYALGYPIADIMGKEIKVTNGIINSTSGFKGSISQFQFSASVQPGNSGGPLLDDKGNIIGVISAKLDQDIAENAGYAIKSDYALFFLGQVGNVEFVPPPSANEAIDLSSMVENMKDYVFIIETE